MKQIYLVNKSKAVLGLFSGVKSRITLTQPLLNHYCVLTVALMLLLGGFSTRVWGANCTYTATFGDVSKTAYGKVGIGKSKGFGTFTICNTNSSLYIVSVSMNVAIDGSGWDQGFSGNLKASDGTTLKSNFSIDCGSSANCSANVNKSGISSISFETSNKYSKTRTVTITGITVTYRYPASLDADDTDLDVELTKVGNTNTATFTVTYQNANNDSRAFTVSETSDANGFFTINPTSTTRANCNGTIDYTITFTPTAPVDNATATYVISGNGATETVTVTGSSWGTADPIYTFNSEYWNADGEQIKQIYVDDTIANVFGTNSSADPTYSITKKSDSGTNNGSAVTLFKSDSLIAGRAGTYEVTIRQEEKIIGTSGYNAGEKTLTVEVSKRPTSFLGSAYSIDVDGTQTADYSYTNVSAAKPTANSNDNFYYTIDNVSFTNSAKNNGNNFVTFNPDNKLITACNAGTGKITLHQKETYKYTGATTSFNVTVNKRANALSCKFDNVTSTTWKKTLYFDEYTVATFSSNHTMNAIQVALKAGDSIASYNPSNGRITSYGNVGDAIWTVWQPENYMYVGDTAECKVTVSRKACPTCYVYEGYIDDNSKTVGETWNDNPTIASWSEDGVANQLTFSMAVNGAGNNAQFARYVSGTWSSDSTLKTSGYHGIWNYDYDDHSVALNAHTTQVRFMKKNTDNPYIKDIRVSRRKWFAIEDLNGNALSQIEMKNYVGGNSTTAQFRVNFSTCDKEVKVISNHPHVTVSYDPINLDNSKGGSGIRTITITYACDVAERINTTISVYTKYEQADLRVIATTELEDQVINWNSDYVSGKSASLPVSFKSDDMATASSDLDVKYITTTPDIIDISADSTIIQVIKESENGVLIAYQAGNDVFKPISDTITVHATNKKIQTIVWSQSFTRNLTLDSVCDLTAKVYITNLLNGSQTYSPERTAKLHYACTGAAGVVTVNDDARTMRIVNYGTTKITATVEDDDDDFELALPVEKQVKVRQLSSGECDGDEPIYANGDKLDLFYLDVSLGNLNTIGMTLAKPEVERSIEIDLSKGVPDSLKCYVHAVPFTISNTSLSRLAGHVEVYTSADNGITWSQKLGTFNPASGDSAICAIAIDRNVNRIKFYRPQGGEGHHYIEDIVVTRKQFIEAENINLGNVAAGAVRKDSILVNYSDARQDFNVTRGLANTKNKLILEDDKMYVSCGETDQQKLPFEFKPKVVGDWRDTVTITDPKTGKTAIVILTATITRGNQVIKWNADTEIDAGEHAPSLNGYSTAGEDYPVSYAITAGSDVAVIREINGVDSVIVKKSGTFTITATQPGDDNFYPAEPVVKTFHVASVAYTYNGDGDWSDDDNWSTKEVPEDGVDVVINGNVTIEDTISVNSLTINEGSEVTLAVGGQLTIGDGDSKTQATYGNLHVETDGQVILNGGELKVNNFILDAALGDVADETQFGVSGQVTNPINLAIITNAYFDLTVDPDGQVTFGWYDFTVPFNVNIAEGIYRLKDDGSMTKLKSGKDFIIARYDEPTRATGKKGWVTVNSGSLHAGETYTITLDDEVTQNVLRFVWDKSSSLGTSYSRPVSYTAPATKSGTSTSGWNGLGNGTLTHAQLQSLPAKAKVQMYDHNAKAYVPVSADKFTYAVGTSFFYQVKNTDPVVLTSAQEDEDHPLRAPQRDARETEEFRLTLTAENSTRTADVMYVSASEDAETEYMVGRDLMKVANPKEATVAQMWASKGDNILCDIEMPLESNYATTPLVLYTPKDGQYVLEVKEAPEDAMLYLTYEGRAIWNLSYSPYVFDLAKGTTEGYGLKLYANPAPQVATGVDEMDAEAQTMRKVMIDNVLYIITPDGAMYDVTGKSVK